MGGGLRGAVEEAVEEFNRHHGAEASARVVEWLEDGFRVEFTGSFCLACGFYDYFDDLALMVRERGYEVEVAGVEEFEGGALVEYRLAGEGVSRARPQRLVLIFDWQRGER